MNWKQKTGWAILILLTLGNAADHPDAAATLFLAGVVIYWGQRINESLKSLKQ